MVVRVALNMNVLNRDDGKTSSLRGKQGQIKFSRTANAGGGP